MFSSTYWENAYKKNQKQKLFRSSLCILQISSRDLVNVHKCKHIFTTSWLMDAEVLHCDISKISKRMKEKKKWLIKLTEKSSKRQILTFRNVWLITGKTRPVGWQKRKKSNKKTEESKKHYVYGNNVKKTEFFFNKKNSTALFRLFFFTAKEIVCNCIK